MIIRRAEEKDTKPFMKLANYCFAEPYEDATLYEETLDIENTRIVEENGKIVGGYTLYPFEMTYCHATVKMGGLSCVVMDVNARYGGYAKKMLTEMLSDMHDRGFVFSALGAFNFEFYRKLGWETAYDRMQYELDIELLKPYLESEYEIEKYYEVPVKKIMGLQTEFAKRYIGYIPRGEEYWKVFEKFMIDGKYLLATVSRAGKAEGYIIYKLKDGKLEAREMVYSDTNSLKALFGFIYRHNSQHKKAVLNVPCDFPLRLMVGDLYRVESKLQIVMMNRVVDVKKAFELGSYPDIGEHFLALKITDKTCGWNDGVWHLYLAQGDIKADRAGEGEPFDAEIDITVLSQMMIGYASGKTLLELGKIDAKTDEAREFIEKGFLHNTTYVNNHF